MVGNTSFRGVGIIRTWSGHVTIGSAEGEGAGLAEDVGIVTDVNVVHEIKDGAVSKESVEG